MTQGGGVRDGAPAGEPKGGSGGTFIDRFRSTTGAAIMAEGRSPVKPTKSKRAVCGHVVLARSRSDHARGRSVLEAGQTKCDIPQATGASGGAEERSDGAKWLISLDGGVAQRVRAAES